MDVVEIKRRFEQLQSKKQELEIERTKLTTQKEISDKELQSKLEQLKEDFGVEGIEAAGRLLSEVEKDLTSKIEECERELGSKDGDS